MNKGALPYGTTCPFQALKMAFLNSFDEVDIND